VFDDIKTEERQIKTDKGSKHCIEQEIKTWDGERCVHLKSKMIIKMVQGWFT
jgi:hypothetical protein